MQQQGIVFKLFFSMEKAYVELEIGHEKRIAIGNDGKLIDGTIVDFSICKYIFLLSVQPDTISCASLKNCNICQTKEAACRTRKEDLNYSIVSIVYEDDKMLKINDADTAKWDMIKEAFDKAPKIIKQYVRYPVFERYIKIRKPENAYITEMLSCIDTQDLYKRLGKKMCKVDNEGRIMVENENS